MQPVLAEELAILSGGRKNNAQQTIGNSKYMPPQEEI